MMSLAYSEVIKACDRAFDALLKIRDLGRGAAGRDLDRHPGLLGDKAIWNARSRARAARRSGMSIAASDDLALDRAAQWFQQDGRASHEAPRRSAWYAVTVELTKSPMTLARGHRALGI